MGLLEDAIAAGAGQGELAQLSSLFQPSMHSSILGAADAALGRGDLPSYNPETNMPWGHWGTLRENEDVKAQQFRDTQRIRLMDSIGKIDDPDLQYRMLMGLGMVAPPTFTPPNTEGMTPTDALMAQQEYDRRRMSGDPMEGYIGGRLKGELMKMRVANELARPQRDLENQIKMLQTQVLMKRQDADDAYKQELIRSRGAGQEIQRMGHLDNLVKALQVAKDPISGNPTLAKALEMMLMSQLGGAAGGGGPTATPSQPGSAISSAPAGPPIFSSREPLAGPTQQVPGLGTIRIDPNMAPEQRAALEAMFAAGGAQPGLTGGEMEPPSPEGVWWDQAMPSSAPPFQPDRMKIAELHRQLAHLQRYAPGDLAAQRRLERMIQDAMLPPLQVPGGGPAAGGKVTVKKVK